VEWIASDTEAGGDVLLAKQRIGGNPAAQFGGKLASLLHGGFRHEDDEFVATVACHDIGAATVAFENLANALKNKVAFQVAIKIVDKLEAVQVHEDEGEGTSGAGRALPFGRESFHKKAMSLDAGEAVRDGLFLGLLEREGVVERAGNQVGEGTEKERFFLGEINAVNGFDIEDAVKVIGIKDGQSHRGKSISEDGLGAVLGTREGAENGDFPGARDLADKAGVERKAESHGATAFAAFGLDMELARGVIKDGDAHVVVGEAVFKLLGNFGEHFIGVERGDGVTGN